MRDYHGTGHLHDQDSWSRVSWPQHTTAVQPDKGWHHTKCSLIPLGVTELGVQAGVVLGPWTPEKKEQRS